ncbi:MAG: hypothetical protein U9R54_07530 [Bacteroidota bacterium]|nr:hypothetical protein [Bacteroidota bacterium]
MPACIEPEVSVDYILKNSTDSKINMFISYYDLSKESIELNINETKIFHVNIPKASNVPPPFLGLDIDTISFVYKDTILKQYHENSSGKNPLILEYYIGEKTGYENGISYYSHQYDILVEDFN